MALFAPVQREKNRSTCLLHKFLSGLCSSFVMLYSYPIVTNKRINKISKIYMNHLVPQQHVMFKYSETQTSNSWLSFTSGLHNSSKAQQKKFPPFPEPCWIPVFHKGIMYFVEENISFCCFYICSFQISECLRKKDK